MFIESPYELNLFFNNLQTNKLYVEPITCSDLKHWKISKLLGLFVKPVGCLSGSIIPYEFVDCINLTSPVSFKDNVYIYTSNKKELVRHHKNNVIYDLKLLNIFTINKVIQYDKFKFNLKTKNKLNPVVKLHEYYEYLYEQFLPVINQDLPSHFNFYNKKLFNIFNGIENCGLPIEVENFIKTNKVRSPNLFIKKSKVFTSFNYYNQTTRITNTFNNVNFLAIPNSEKHRSCIVPEYDFFLELDFDGYHIRLIAEYLNIKLNGDSAHLQIQDYPDKKHVELKKENFTHLYGHSVNYLLKKPFFIKYDEMLQQLKPGDYLTVPQSGLKIQVKPNKKISFNYFVQALETARNTVVLRSVQNLLKKDILQLRLCTYDSMLFDVSHNCCLERLLELKEKLTEKGKYPLKYKKGTSLFFK